MNRPNFNQYCMNIARDVSMRSTCIRRQYGAIIVEPNTKRIISTGYNGAPRECPNCDELGKCIRQELNIAPGTRYENCRSIHAELNALLNSHCNVSGMDMYVYGMQDGKPIDTACCLMCKRAIINTGIKKVICSKPENNEFFKFNTFSVDEWILQDNVYPFKQIEENMK